MADHRPCDHCRLATGEDELEAATMGVLHLANGTFHSKLTHYQARQMARVALGLISVEQPHPDDEGTDITASDVGVLP